MIAFWRTEMIKTYLHSKHVNFSQVSIEESKETDVKKKQQKPTTPVIPGRSPIQVLTEPDVA